MKSLKNLRVVMAGMLVLFMAVSCSSGSGGSNKSAAEVPIIMPSVSLTPTEAAYGMYSVQDISAMDVAQLGLTPPAEFQGSAMTAAIASGPGVQSLPPADPRWLFMLQPMRPRGQDEELPRLGELAAATRYLLATRPACATIVETGTCPPDPNTADSTCTSDISFPADGCVVTVTLPPPPPPPEGAPLPPAPPSLSIIFSGALHMVGTITQAGTPPQVKGALVVTATDFKIGDPMGGFMQYNGTVEEAFDGTTPTGGFTLTRSSPASDPLTITEFFGLQTVIEGTQTIAVIPQTSFYMTADGSVTISMPNPPPAPTPPPGMPVPPGPGIVIPPSPPSLPPLTMEIHCVKSADFDGTSMHLTLDRTVTHTAANLTFHRTVDVTLTPSGDPVTSVTVNGTESFTGPLGVTVNVTVTGVALDLGCRTPKGGTVVIEGPLKTVTITFDTECNCMATWSDNLGNSGTMNLCPPMPMPLPEPVMPG